MEGFTSLGILSDIIILETIMPYSRRLELEQSLFKEAEETARKPNFSSP
jgi:hypothetical protein